MKNLAKTIHRQRLVIEGTMPELITDEHIKDYLSQLSGRLEMTTLIEPVTHQSPQYGWAGWIHWETSGAHFYAWDQPVKFFSVDIYTCKKFSEKDAIKFTKEYFNADKIAHKSF